MYRIGIVVLVVLLAGLQYRLWVGDGSYAQVHRLQQRIVAINTANTHKRARNKRIRARIRELKSGTSAAERLARTRMGMVKSGEQFFLTTHSQNDSADR